MKSSPLPLLARLKEATLAEHRAVEASMSLMREEVTLAEYQSYLLRMLVVHQPFEGALPQMGEVQRAIPDLAERMKVPLLAEDLQALEVLSSERAQVSSIATSLQSVPNTLGALYVLEGSTLGGKVILKHLARVLGARIEGAHAYLGAYGPEAMPMWRKLGQALQGWTDSHGGEEEVIEGAVKMFARIRRVWEPAPQAL